MGGFRGNGADAVGGRSSGREEGNRKADMVGIHMQKEERFN